MEEGIKNLKDNYAGRSPKLMKKNSKIIALVSCSTLVVLSVALLVALLSLVLCSTILPHHTKNLIEIGVLVEKIVAKTQVEKMVVEIQVEKTVAKTQIKKTIEEILVDRTVDNLVTETEV